LFIGLLLLIMKKGGTRQEKKPRPNRVPGGGILNKGKTPKKKKHLRYFGQREGSWEEKKSEGGVVPGPL